MSTNLPPAVARLVARAERDPDVLAVFLFGSHVRREATSRSDVDICLVLASADGAPRDGTRAQLAYLSEFDLDVAVFQRVPLAMRSRILKDGKLLFVRDEDALYALAIRTVRAWGDFRHIHQRYLDEVARD
jgi:predicted nucleotidyltransferase